jgi:hypothetical protein
MHDAPTTVRLAAALYRRFGLKPGTDARLHLGTRLPPAE